MYEAVGLISEFSIFIVRPSWRVRWYELLGLSKSGRISLNRPSARYIGPASYPSGIFCFSVRRKEHEKQLVGLGLEA